MFRQTRPSKKLMAILLLAALLVIVFFYRRPIAIKSIEYFAQSQGIKVNCLDFSLDWQLNLKVKQACIDFAAGELLVREAKWQPWSNVLSIQLLHLNHLATNNQVAKKSADEPQTNELNLPDALPKLSIATIEIHSPELREPLHLSIHATSSNHLSITGDIKADIKMQQNTLVGNLEWRLSDLTKWLPQAQKLTSENPELLAELAADDSKIHTRIFFDGEVLGADSRLEMGSSVKIANCPLEVAIKGELFVELALSSLNLSLDLSELESKLKAAHCPLLQAYFAEDDLPHLSFILPQKVVIDETQLSLPELHLIDKQNSNRSLDLRELIYQFTGELAVSYKLAVNQPIAAKQLQAGNLNLQAQGNLSSNLSSLSTQQPVSLEINDAHNLLVVNHLKMDSLNIADIKSEFTLQYSDNRPLNIHGRLTSSGIKIGDIKLTKTISDFIIKGASLSDLQLSIDNQLIQLAHPEAKIQNISNHLDVNIKEWAALSFTGNSTVTNLTAQNIKFQPITMTHTGQANLPDITTSSEHNIGLEQGFELALKQQNTELALHIAQQELKSLQGIISQLENQLILEQGSLSATIDFTLPQEEQPFIAKGSLAIQDVSAKYQDYILNNINYQTPLTFDSAGLQLAESTLHIDSINAGVPIEQLDAKVIAKDNVFRLEQVQGEIFNGKFSSRQLWLDGRDQQVNIAFQNIDLAQVVALQKQPGIKITGNLDGDLPMIINKQGISIDEGWASSLSGGKLTIVDNPSFDSIKQQQPELALLENLDFTQLKSKVKFTPDGWMFFDFALNGNNPDKKQSVNFNYTHQENIFSLLESIRLVNAVENKIEQKITQGDKK
tara:strand:- start:48019 stop:50535 length:2517 start_codon:yes stop_codon:yes gene_type:complete